MNALTGLRWIRGMSLALMLVTAALLTGCAGNPIVKLKPPPNGGRDTLSSARQYADEVRETYRQAIARQVDESTALNTGLVGIGAAVLGAALGGAHRDVIVGGALLGGTGYALGKLNVDPRRSKIYSEGIKALNCAIAAVTPLDLDPADNQVLRQAISDIRDRLGNVEEARVEVVNARSKVSSAIKNEITATADEAVRAADAASTEGRKSLEAAQQLAVGVAQAGPQLMNATRRITQAVDNAQLDTLADISAVPKAIAGLPGLAGLFAPGAGVDKSSSAALATYDAAITAKGKSTKVLRNNLSPEEQVLQDKTDVLLARVSALRSASTVAQSIVGSVDGSTSLATLKDCNIGDVSTRMTVDPELMKVTAADTEQKRELRITGGKAPYSVRMDDSGAGGVTLEFGGGFDDTAKVVISKEAKGDYGVVVSDSSSPKQTRQVTVRVGPKASADEGGTGDGKSKAGDTDRLVTDFIKGLNTAGQITMDDGKQLKIAAKPAAGGKIQVAVTCGAPPGHPYPKSDLRQKLIDSQPEGKKLPGDQQWDVQGATDCVGS